VPEFVLADQFIAGLEGIERDVAFLGAVGVAIKAILREDRLNVFAVTLNTCSNLPIFFELRALIGATPENGLNRQSPKAPPLQAVGHYRLAGFLCFHVTLLDHVSSPVLSISACRLFHRARFPSRLARGHSTANDS
jgi:hypothetical protein